MNKSELKSYTILRKQEDELWAKAKELVEDDGIWEEIRDTISDIVEVNLAIEELTKK